MKMTLEITPIQESSIAFLQQEPALQAVANKLSALEMHILDSLISLGLGPSLLSSFRAEDEEGLRGMLSQLIPVERFYAEIGGIVGYHRHALACIHKKEGEERIVGESAYSRAPGIDFSADPCKAHQEKLFGIWQLDQVAQLYPVGGAGDRLDLCASDGTPLPAALLRFGGRTLLEGLIRDLQAEEYLHYKLYGNQVKTPVALMTSDEKGNDRLIRSLCNEHNWFARGKELFSFFVQPLVPVITEEGLWKKTGHLQIALKPGGHGVIWKLAKEMGIFEWLKKQGRKKLLVRQINNPLAGVDLGLLAFLGHGCREEKEFGFLSCERVVGAAEGVLVLVHEQRGEQNRYGISNLEYTDFPRFGIEDRPKSPGEHYSLYPSNTNVLFADIASIEKTVTKEPFPGLIVNPKQERLSHIKEGRLEATMQNISDQMWDRFDAPQTEEELCKALSTFVVYNDRAKTISTTKRSFKKGAPLMETPEGAFYDLCFASWKLLKDCHFDLPPFTLEEEYLQKGPSPFFLYHPALGPTYEVIAQKLRRGILHQGAELQLEIAQIDCEGLDLDGSLLIHAKASLGHLEEGKLIYSEEVGRVRFQNVRVMNAGRSKLQNEPAWKNRPKRDEALQIHLLGLSEFEAKDVTFNGPIMIEVPHQCKVTAFMDGDEICFKKEKIETPTWRWTYSVGENHSIKLAFHRLFA